MTAQPQGQNCSQQRRCTEHLSMLLSMLELRLPFLRGRGIRILSGARLFAAELQLGSQELFCLSLAACFQDLGYVAIPDTILLKPRGLTDQERMVVNRHSGLGSRFISKNFPNLPKIAEAIRYHHERPDGLGPCQLQGRQIPIVAAIVHICEVIEALANDRPYRSAISLERMIEIIHRGKGTEFPFFLVDLFVSHASEFYRMMAAHPEATIRTQSLSGRVASLRASLPAAAMTRPPMGGGVAVAEPRPSPGPSAIADRRGVGLSENQRQDADTLNNPYTSFRDLKPIISGQELINVIEGSLELMPLDATSQNVLALTNNPRCAMDEVAKEISHDQALAVRILRVANSSAYARGKVTNNLKDAVSRIGVQQVRDLVMTLNMLEQSQGYVVGDLDTRMLWEHSLAVALAGSLIGQACRLKATENLFLLGILHDVGRLILMEHAPQLYKQVSEASRALDVPLEATESRMLSLDHCSLLKLALEKWHFPKELVIPASSHHFILHRLQRLPPDSVPLAMTVALANHLVRALCIGSSGNDFLHPVDELAQALQVPDETLHQIEQNLADETAGLKISLLARSRSESWQDHLATLRKQIKRHVVPMCVSRKPVTDVFRMFMEKLLIGMDAQEKPNLGVIYLREADEISMLLGPYEQREKENAGQSLPLLIICGKGQVNSNHAWFKSRRCLILDAPVSAARLIQTVNELLSTAAQ